MKIKTISRSEEDFCRKSSLDITKVHTNTYIFYFIVKNILESRFAGCNFLDCKLLLRFYIRFIATETPSSIHSIEHENIQKQ